MELETIPGQPQKKSIQPLVFRCKWGTQKSCEVDLHDLGAEYGVKSSAIYYIVYYIVQKCILCFTSNQCKCAKTGVM